MYVNVYEAFGTAWLQPDLATAVRGQHDYYLTRREWRPVSGHWHRPPVGGPTKTRNALTQLADAIDARFGRDNERAAEISDNLRFAAVLRNYEDFEPANNLNDELAELFTWRDTPQGFDFWSKAHDWLESYE